MKMIAIIEVPDDMYDAYQDWYITSNDDLEIRYEEDGAYVNLKNLDKLKLKPLPIRKEIYEVIYQAYRLGKDETYTRLREAVDKLLDEIIGEQE